MCRSRHIPSKPEAISRPIKKRVGECHSPTLFLQNKKARTARIGHRGHVSAATHSLEAGNSLPEQKKAASLSETASFVYYCLHFNDDVILRLHCGGGDVAAVHFLAVKRKFAATRELAAGIFYGDI